MSQNTSLRWEMDEFSDLHIESRQSSESGNLPHPRARLIGRAAALDALEPLIAEEPLVTLCGPGGAGKTLLALTLARQLRGQFPGGAWWVDLSATLDPSQVAHAVAGAIAPDEATTDPTPAAIVRRLREPALLVLDNCEQLIDACSVFVEALITQGEHVHVLATSRRPLGISYERLWRIGGLSLDGRPGPDGDAAINLFAERARQAVEDFTLIPDDHLDAARSICALLDGMPLAIELAAARVPLVGVVPMAERLAQDTAVLRQTRRGVPDRHRSLEATLDWSHALLSPGEQILFRRLSVFRGAFSLVDAESVCVDGELPAAELLDALESLVDGSLVKLLPGDGAPQFRLLGIVRQYAAAKLETGEDAAAARGRHAAHFARALAALAEAPGAHAATTLLDTIATRLEDVLAALEWLLGDSVDEAARLAGHVWRFWGLRGQYREARDWFGRILAVGDPLPAALRAETLFRAAEAAFLQCDYAEADDLLRQALEIARAINEVRIQALVAQRLGSIAREQGRYDEAETHHQHSLELWRELGDGDGVSRARAALGFVAWLSGRPEEAEEPCAAALADFQRQGHDQEAAETLVHLGAAALYTGAYQSARDLLDEALTLSRRIHFQEGIAWALHERAILARHRRRPTADSAPALFEALEIHQRLGDRWRCASVLEEIAGGPIARSDPGLAVTLMAAADAIRVRIGAPVPPAEADDRAAALTRLRSRLDDAEYASRWSDGATLRLDDAVELALGGLDQRLAAPLGADDAVSLTERELAVLRLMSEGRTNREIGLALHISPSTAGVHVSNILHKLGSRRRSDAVARGLQLGLITAAEPGASGHR